MKIKWKFTILFSLLTVTLLAAAERPNIVVILCDDRGFSDLGCYGGVRFTQFYNCARCCPTRASLLTGLYPHQAGVGHMMNDDGHPVYTGNLNSECRTLAEVLHPAGYRNYAVGKWHVTRHAEPNGDKHNWPRQRSFDRYYGTIHGAGSYFDPGTLTKDNTQISAFADPDYKPATFYYTDAISDHTVRFVGEHAKNHAGKPFFISVAFTGAHWPMQALPEDIARNKGNYDAGYEPFRKARFEKSRQAWLDRSGPGHEPGCRGLDRGEGQGLGCRWHGSLRRHSRTHGPRCRPDHRRVETHGGSSTTR